MPIILRLSRILLLFLFIPLLFSCSKKQPKSKSRPPAPVSVASAVTGDLPQILSVVGTVEPVESVSIKPLISGELSAVYFGEGQEVSKGQKLFLIDPRPLQAALKKAEASMARNRVIMDNAKKDYVRYAQLVKDGIVTQEQAEAYRTRAESAAADLDADRAAVENARVQLSYCTITSPVAGRTGNLAVTRGNVVEANKTTLTSINSISPIYVTFGLPERDLPSVKARMANGRLDIDAEINGGGMERGNLVFIDNAVDPATGTIKLKGSFGNRNRKLWPGQFVQVSVALAERKGAVVVPAQAVQTGQKGSFVFVVRSDMTAEARTIVTGPAHKGHVAIDKGLAAGEQVVVEGQMRVVPDGKVEIKKPEQKNDKQPVSPDKSK